LWAEHRARRSAVPQRLSVAVAVAAPYLFLVPYVAPRFLLPTLGTDESGCPPSGRPLRPAGRAGPPRPRIPCAGPQGPQRHLRRPPQLWFPVVPEDRHELHLVSPGERVVECHIVRTVPPIA
jgi:hypothetical protein